MMDDLWSRPSARNARGALSKTAVLLGLVLRIADIVVLAGCALLAYRLRFGIWTLGIEFERAAVRGVLIALSVLGFSSLYRTWRASSIFPVITRLVSAWLLVFVLGILYVAFLKVEGVTSRLWWGYWFVATIAGSCGAHLMCRWLMAKAREAGHDQCNVVIVGTVGESGRLVREFSRQRGAMNLRGWFGVDSNAACELNAARLGGLDSLWPYVRAHGIKQVWIALPLSEHAWVEKILATLKHSTADIKLVPNLGGLPVFNGSVEQLNGLPVINLRKSPLDGEARVAKGLEDRILATLILMLISPLLLAIAIGVKLSSPGPVLFRQRRHGLDCREIEVWKFRSMRVHQEAAGTVTQATKHDARVTSFGRFLRRTSLDELPQFFNVLQGTMSIVGPRPHAIAHNDHYKEIVQNYMQRHRVKPGITGWAQVNGLRGETDTVDKMAARVEYDLHYIQNWSVLFDIKIIGRTMLKGFVGQTAY